MGVATSFAPVRFINSRIPNQILESTSSYGSSIHETKLFRSKSIIGLARFIVQEFPKGVPIFNMSCSYGHEPYSIALILADQLGGLDKVAERYPIFASDRSREVIDFANHGVLWVDDKNQDTLDQFKASEHIINPIRVDDNITEFQVSDELFNVVRFRVNNLIDEVRNIDSQAPVVIVARNVWYYLDADSMKNSILALTDKLAVGSIVSMSNGDSQWSYYGRYPVGNYFACIYDDISARTEERDIFWEKTIFQKK